MDSEEEERLRQWKQHLASQRNGGDDSDDPGSSDNDGAVKHGLHARTEQPRSARLGNAARGTSANKKHNERSSQDSLAENGPVDSQSIDWASALMPQLRELQEENLALRSKAAAHEKEIRRIRLEQQAIGGLDVSSTDGPKSGGDLKDSKIVELAKKNRTLTVRSCEQILRQLPTFKFLDCHSYIAGCSRKGACEIWQNGCRAAGTECAKLRCHESCYSLC